VLATCLHASKTLTTRIRELTAAGAVADTLAVPSR
jgi:hypothetical protein